MLTAIGARVPFIYFDGQNEPVIRLEAFAVEDSNGLCEICREKAATRTCELCGRRVCDADWRSGYCAACENALCRVCRKRLSVGYCAVCGKLVCEDCSIELGAARVCKPCALELGLNTRR
jgi:hypothetical protein